ncbi:MAG: BREX protein BrxB domain-containing protein [Alkalispirochaetaceae bacterium]
MHDVGIAKHFEQVYQIVSHPRFLARKGLGNEVPFFVDVYKPENEFAVKGQIHTLYQRLQSNGIETVALPMYEIVLEVLKNAGRLQSLFDWEPKAPKTGARRTFLSEMEKFTDPAGGKRLQQEILSRLEAAPGHKLVLMYELGTIFPFLRTHTLLNNLHAVITEVPLVAFFPGKYVSSDREGFYLSLFGKFNGDYYRAFQLQDYIERGKIRADVE